MVVLLINKNNGEAYGEFHRFFLEKGFILVYLLEEDDSLLQRR